MILDERYSIYVALSIVRDGVVQINRIYPSFRKTIYTSFEWPQDGKRESAGRGGRPAPRLWRRTQRPCHAGHSDGLNPSAQ